MVEPCKLVPTVSSKEELVEFIRVLIQDLHIRPQEWENPTLDRYLDALASWLEASDNFYRNVGRGSPTDPTWMSIAEMLIAAKIYE